MPPRLLYRRDIHLALGDNPMAETQRQRWARVPPHLAWKRPGLPTDWCPVLARNPEAMNPEALPGYGWLDTPGKVLHVEASRLEFRLGPTALS
jgi:hypothetical protein